MGKIGAIFGIFNAVASVCAFALGDVGHGLFFAGGAAGSFMIARQGGDTSSPASAPKSGLTL